MYMSTIVKGKIADDDAGKFDYILSWWGNVGVGREHQSTPESILISMLLDGMHKKA